MTASQHDTHGWTQQYTAHIHNVPYLITHRLMLCPCGFYGWIPESEFGVGNE